jgi:hypothetical protein
MLFEPRVYNLSILMVRPIPLHSFNRAGSVGARAWRTVGCVAIVGSRRVCDSPVLRRHSIVRLPLLVLCVASMSAYPEENVVVAIDDGPALITIRLHHRFAVPQKEDRRGVDRTSRGPRAHFPCAHDSIRDKGQWRQRSESLDLSLDRETQRQHGEAGWQRQGPGPDHDLQ